MSCVVIVGYGKLNRGSEEEHRVYWLLYVPWIGQWGYVRGNT